MTMELQAALCVAVLIHGAMWVKTGEGLWFWLAEGLMLIRRAEITTYRWAIPAARAWRDEFVHFQERGKKVTNG